MNLVLLIAVGVVGAIVSFPLWRRLINNTDESVEQL